MQIRTVTTSTFKQIISHQTILLLTLDFRWSAPPAKPHYGPEPAGHTMLSPSIQINES